MIDPPTVARAILGLLEVLIGVFVLMAAPHKRVNQFLGFFLIYVGTLGMGIWLLAADALRGIQPWEDAVLRTHFAVRTSFGFAYLLFIGHMFTVPATRWIRSRAGMFSLLVAMPVAMIAYAATPRESVWEIAVETAGIFALVIAAMFGLILSVKQYRNSVGANKQRAGAYLLAFAWRDLVYLFLSVVVILQTTGAPANVNALFDYSIMSLFIPDLLLMVGLLRGQVLALDYKVLRAGVGVGTLALLAISGILLSEWLEGWLSERTGVVGAVVALGVAGAFVPVERSTRKVVRRLFPDAKPVKDMAVGEKESAYRVQVELAWSDGVIDELEDEMLRRSAAHLGLSGVTVRSIHRAVGVS